MELSTDNTPVSYAAGFWRRSIAFLVDALVLGLVGALAGWALFDVFARMGGYARVVGLVVALAFFGVMNSALFGGQTLGKRLLKVRVVGKDGALLSLPQSLLRYTILGVPFFLNGAPFDSAVLFSPMGYVLSLLIFGGMLSILYLYVFNRHGRRSLHDLVVGSSVVSAQTPIAAVRPQPVWRVHVAVVGVLLIAAAIMPAFTGRLAQGDLFKDLLLAHEAVNAEPGVQNAQLVHSTSFRSGSANVQSAIAQVKLAEPRVDDGALAEHLARVILANDQKAAAMSTIQVTLVYGYDLGIASSWRSHSYQFDPNALAAGGRTAVASGSMK